MNKEKAKNMLNPIVNFLAKKGVRPDHLTISGVFLSIIPGILYALNLYLIAGILLLLFSLLDTLDGQLARRTGQTSSFGGVIDSTFDRIQEGIIFAGIIYSFSKEPLAFILVFFSFLFSLMISYIRARGEGYGFSTKKGPMERTERILYLGIASLFGKKIFFYTIFPFIILIFLTFLRRLFNIRKNLKS